MKTNNKSWQKIKVMSNSRAHVIVISNEKGGTGKSTISMHLAIKLMQEKFRVAVVDMDGRQSTLSHYITNRKKFCSEHNLNLPIPELLTIEPKEDTALFAAHRIEVEKQIAALLDKYDALVIDTPGNKNYLFEEAHKFADTLITPMSDSLIDLNVISEVDFAHPDDRHAGRYAQYIWDIKKYLAAHGKPMLNWIVVGNKISSLNSRNKNQVFGYLEKAAKTYGFRVAPTIRDRVIYKELFLQGLTVLDLSQDALKCRLSVSHIAAKQEIRQLAEFICPQN